MSPFFEFAMQLVLFAFIIARQLAITWLVSQPVQFDASCAERPGSTAEFFGSK